LDPAAADGMGRVMKKEARPLKIALDVIARGYSPVPVPIGAKGPKLPEWQKLRITSETASQYFNGAKINVGAIMGPPSNGLADVDLDCSEAVRLAPYFLPRTSAIYGRPGKRKSHHLYKCTDPEPKAWIKLTDENKKAIVELRLGGGGKGAQSMAGIGSPFRRALRVGPGRRTGDGDLRNAEAGDRPNCNRHFTGPPLA
jgi:hypothetical protein